MTSEITEKLEKLERSLVTIGKECGLDYQEILNILSKRGIDRVEGSIPLSAFSRKLSALETIVKYMKENLSLNYKEIAYLLGRNYFPIAVTYRNSRLKKPGRLSDGGKKIPIGIFSDQKFTILENLCRHMKDEMGLTYHEIARLLHRDDRTIWTVYNRKK